MFRNSLEFSDRVKGNLYLILASIAWGTTFVVQRTAMDYLGPFSYSGIRFLLGSLFLLPFVVRRYHYTFTANKSFRENVWLPVGASLLTGTIVCIGINLQQFGLIYSTAGKGGFITGLYVIIVPLLGIIGGQRAGTGVWGGAILAVVGLYLLSITTEFTLAPGDVWILACAFVWALQVHALSWLSPKIDSFVLAFGQSFVCGCLSLIIALFSEKISMTALSLTWFDLLYGGFISVGIGYTLQVAGQKYAKASHAAIIMQFEAVFAVIAGWVFLGEVLSPRGITGCAFMLSGMLVSQLASHRLQHP